MKSEDTVIGNKDPQTQGDLGGGRTAQKMMTRCLLATEYFDLRIASDSTLWPSSPTPLSSTTREGSQKPDFLFYKVGRHSTPYPCGSRKSLQPCLLLFSVRAGHKTLTPHSLQQALRSLVPQRLCLTTWEQEEQFTKLLLPQPCLSSFLQSHLHMAAMKPSITLSLTS